MDETLVFIDAGFLSKLAKHFGQGKYLKYNIIKLSHLISKKQNLFCKQIFYYTAPPFQSENPNKDEESRKEKYDKFLSSLNKNKGITIREGRCQRLKINGKFEYSQKGVDSLMVMDLMNILFDYPEIKKILILASDSDFVPIINNLKNKGVNIVLHTYYETGRKAIFSTSNYLIKSVNKYVKLTKQDFLDSNL